MAISPKVPAVAVACTAALIATFAVGADMSPLERAVEARQGVMEIHVLEAGPLFAMIKGDMPYDAKAATDHAKALKALTNYDETRLFPKGTSTEDMPGKTAALPAIWEKPDEFQKAYEALRTAVDHVAAVAGEGKDAMTPAVKELGKSCGDCHHTFRQKKQ